MARRPIPWRCIFIPRSSEQNGSMDGHLFQAAKNAVDVLWWTDHDHRMDGIGYRDVTHFTSFSEKGAPGQGGAWNWTSPRAAPTPPPRTGGIVAKPCSPNDPVARAVPCTWPPRAAAPRPAKFGYFADCHPAGWNYRDNLTGQSLLIDVLLSSSGWSADTWSCWSRHPSTRPRASRPAGNYTLSYRFTPAERRRGWPTASTA